MASDVTLQDIQAMNINQYFTLIAMSLVVYEYWLTFPAEVDRFWMGGPLNWASGLFYLNRYLILVGHIPIMIEYFWDTRNPNKMTMSVPMPLTNICHKLQSYHQYLAIAIQLIVASMLIMRMYALYERKRKVLGLYIGVSLVVAAIGVWAVLGTKDKDGREVDFPLGCSAALTHEEGVRLGAAWTGMLVFDALVFGMTVYKSLVFARSSPDINLLTVLLRDGAIYFAVMMASNLGNILTFLCGGPFTRGIVTTFTNVISSVMITRLMLNLRDPALMRHTQKNGPMLTDGTMTYPNLTFVEPNFSTVQSEGCVRPQYESFAAYGSYYGYAGGTGVGAGDVEDASPDGRRIRDSYNYLAAGSSRKVGKDVELAAIRAERP